MEVVGIALVIAGVYVILFAVGYYADKLFGGTN